MTLVEFLRYAMTSAGVNAAVGFVLSFLAEWWPGYAALPPLTKRLAMMALCFVVPLGAAVGLWLIAGDPLTVETLWAAMQAGFAAFFGSQAAHARVLSATVNRNGDAQ